MDFFFFAPAIIMYRLRSMTKLHMADVGRRCAGRQPSCDGQPSIDGPYGTARSLCA